MGTVTVTVKRRFWHGRDVFPGERIAMSPVDAAVAARAGRVSLSKPAATYRTTALVAEPPAPPEPVAAPRPAVEEPAPDSSAEAALPAEEQAPVAEPSPAAPAPRARRTYRRRDMVAEPTQQPDGVDA